MWNFGYHLARARGAAARRKFAVRLPQIVARRIEPPRALDLDVFAYSGESALPEQIASIRSFLTHVGRPPSFHIVSDGSHSAESRALLQRIDDCVSVEDVPPISNVSPAFKEYLVNHPTGRQLALIMSLPRERPAFYIDSDVLFFGHAGLIGDLSAATRVPALYLQDCQFSGDERLLSEAEKNQPVNTGALMLFRKLDWQIAAERFERLGGASPTFFTNQTLTHLALHVNGAAPFDPLKFVLQLDDQFIFPDRYAGPEIALRHYVNPVRHKFWTSLSRAS